MSQESNNFTSFDIEKQMELLLKLAYENLAQLDVNKQEDLNKLALILKKKISTLGIMEKQFEEELIFNIFNRLANENNKQANIQASLNFMVLALKVINQWEHDQKKYELPEMQVTVLSELLLNISNAELYLGQYDLVHNHSDRAIQIAQKVITNVLKFIKDPTHQNDDLMKESDFMQRIQAHVQTQREILVHAHTRKAEAQEQLAGNQVQKLNETLQSYEKAYDQSQNIFGKQNNFSFDIDKNIQRIKHKIQKANIQDKKKNKSAQKYAINQKNNLSKDLIDVRTITDYGETFDHEDNFDGANKSIIQSSSKSTSKKRIKSPDEKEGDKKKFKHGGRLLKQKSALKIKKKESSKEKTKGTNLNQSFNNNSIKTDENFLNHSILGGYRNKSGGKVKKTRPTSAKPAGFQTEKQINKRLDYGIMGASINHLDARQGLQHVHYDHAGYKRPKIYGYDINHERQSHQLHDSCQSLHSAHRFSHEIQELGLTNAIKGPKSWHYILNPPKYRMTVQRLKNTVFVKPISNQSTTHHKVIKMKANQFNTNYSNIDLSPQVEILKIMREKVKQNEEDRKRNIQEMKLKIDKENLETLKEFERRVIQLELEHEQMEIEILGEMERQRHLIELHEKEMQEEQQLTIQLVNTFQEQLVQFEQQESSDSDEQQCQCNSWSCLQCNPPPPNIDDDFGPPVFDPYYKCWTFPYAKPKPKEVKVEQIKYVPRPLPLTQSIEIQVTPPPEPKVPSSEVIIQTIEFKTPQNSQEIQTIVQYAQAETQTLKKQIDKKAKALIIQNFLWKLVMKSRLKTYREHNGILLTRKYRISKVSGALEILSFFVKTRFVDGMSSYINIIIYDYVTRKYIFDLHYKQIRSIRLFSGWQLRHLCWESLLYIQFEETPFNEHITAIQSIIDYNIPSIDNLEDFNMSDEKSSDDEWVPIEDEIVEPKTPDPIIVYPEMVKTENRKINTKSYCIKKIPFRRACFIIFWWWKIKKAIKQISLLKFEGYNGFDDCINCQAYLRKGNWRHCNNQSKMICKGRHNCEGCRGNWACSKKQKPGTCACCAETDEDFCKCTEARVWIVRQEKYRDYRYLRCYREDMFSLQFNRVDRVIIAETCKQMKCICGCIRDFDVKLWKIYFAPGTSGQAPQNYKYSLEANETKQSIKNHESWKKKQGDLYDQDEKNIPTDFQQYIYENIRLPLSSEEMKVLEEIYGPEYFLPRRPQPQQEKIKVERMITLKSGKQRAMIVEEDPEVDQKFLQKSKEFRGPKGEILFQYYFDNAILMEIEQNCRIRLLKLVRVNINWRKEIPTVIKRDPDELGCIKKLGQGFQLRPKGDQKQLNHTCILYRRIRLIDIKNGQGKWEKTKRKYKDWKIKVRDNATGQYDYIVFHKLPCKLSMMEEWLQDTLYVQLQDNVDPKPIDYLYWEVFKTSLAQKISHCMADQKSLVIFSWMYYKQFDDTQFNIKYDNSIYFSQRYENSSNQQQIMSRLPPIEYLTRNFEKQPLKDGYDPLYVIVIQRLKPKVNYFPVIPYKTDGAKNHSREKNKYKYKKEEPEKLPEYSSTESEDDEYISKDSRWAWDKSQLQKIQVDDFTGSRQYRRIYIGNTINKDDMLKIFYDQKLEQLNKDLWPNSQYLLLQYIVNQIRIYQQFIKENNSIKIQKVLLKLPDNQDYSDEKMFYSQRLHNNSLRFISQDKCNWKNQDFIKTIYCIEGIQGEKGYMVEAIKIEKPDERAYCVLPSLDKADIEQIYEYLDEYLVLKGKERKIGKKGKDEQTGGPQLITGISFNKTIQEFLKDYKKQDEEEGSSYEEEGEDEQEEQKIQEKNQKKK